jgi:general secretion pathway protein D
VDNEVYFTISATPGIAATATSPAIEPTYQTSVNTVPIGFLMSVTPQISASGEVILNLRPTISRISGYALDPNPVLAANNLSNPIPIIQTREMESLMRVRSGDIAILGGLMQDAHNDRRDEVPGLNRVPAVGELFRFRDRLNRKSELVVFLRPTVLDDANASLEDDFGDHRHLLSDARNAFDAPAAPHPH